MTTSRRRFIQSASAVGALAALPGSVFAQGSASKSLDLLVLGGTGFIGPHEINYAKARGHNVTMFNRGKTAPGMFPDVEALIGDRDDQLDALKGRTGMPSSTIPASTRDMHDSLQSCCMGMWALTCLCPASLPMAKL